MQLQSSVRVKFYIFKTLIFTTLVSSMINRFVFVIFRMFMSFPHFYGADTSYLEAVDGLQPEKDKHQAFITLETVII